MKKTNRHAKKQVDKLLGLDELAGKKLYTIVHTHCQGHTVYAFSTVELQQKAKAIIERNNQDDIESGIDFVDEGEEIVDEMPYDEDAK